MATEPTTTPVIQAGFDTGDLVRSIWSFVVPFVVVFAIAMTGVANDLVESCKDKCDWSAASSASIAAIVGLASALLIAVKNWLLANGSALKG